MSSIVWDLEGIIFKGVNCSLVPRPSITANAVEGLVKLLRRMTSGGRRTFGGVVNHSHRN